MNLLCKTNADEIEILLAKVEDSINTLAGFAESELSDVQMLSDESFRKNFSSNLEKSALHHIENTEGTVAIWFHYDEKQIGKTDGFFYVKNETSNTFERQPLTIISDYERSDSEHVNWWYAPIQQGGPVWLEAYYDSNVKQSLISYIVPIYKNEKLLGVIGADLSTDYIESIVKKIEIYESGKAAILNSDGRVVYHPNFERGHLLGQGDRGFDGVIEALSKEQQTNKLISYKLNGVDKKIASCKLRNGMIMVCFAPVSEIYAKQYRLVLFSAIIIFAVMMASLLIAFFVSKEIARPIKKLNKAAKLMTEGEFDYDISTKSRDEIGQLTSTFIETRKILKHQFDLLDAEAHKDGLTSVGNKSAFMDRELEINKNIADRTASFSIAVFDVNRLKITNDVFGHMAGDKLLSTISGFLLSFFDTKDIFRMGGDEFVVIVHEKDPKTCSQLFNECVSVMRTLTVEGVPECRVSCAYGVAHYNPNSDHQLSDVLRRADKEMYNNKALSKKESFPWQKGEKGIKQLQVEKYCQMLQSLTTSTDDYLFLMNTETGVIRFFGEDPNSFEIADGRELTNGISDMLSFVHANDHQLVTEAVAKVINHDSEFIDINFRMYNSSRQLRWVNCRGSVIKDETDSHFVVIGRISQNAVKHLYNPITTLFNKNKLTSDIQNNLTDKFNCLMLIDIDNLSEINIKHGSSYGDKLLKSLADELEKRFSLRQVYHTEKDLFIILLDVKSSKDVEQIFEEIKASLSGKCSISASVVPNDKALYISDESIYDYAVQILNNSKKDGIGQIVFFSKESLLERISTVEILEEIELSIKNKCEDFFIEYQPQIDTKDYSIISAEALLRYNSKTHGQVCPDKFIPVLEQTGLINDVGIWVIDETLRQCKLWRKYNPDFTVSVNVSPKQLKNKNFASQIELKLAKHELPGSALIIEITESTQLKENDDSFEVISQLRQFGIRIAIDDFGAGYSNLSNLKHINASILKIDRMFIRDIKENGYNYRLIDNVIEFAKSNSLKVCLEGIETTNEFAILSELNADILQGYLFDKPCAPDVLEAKYFFVDSDEYKARLNNTEQLKELKKHTPVINMETKTILRGINVGLWIIRINTQSGEGELYTDETMRKLLGVEDDITPKECFKYLQKNIDEKYYSDVKKMIDDMSNSNNVVQVEYQWHHPQKNTVTIRCSGRCTEKKGNIVIFEGFHRIIDNI